MCTVSYIPQDLGRFLLTSNRDEKGERQADNPVFRYYNGNKLVFPKDPVSGGSWIAVNENGRICCLLNGGFVNHEKRNRYSKSRGHVVLDLVSSALLPELFFDIEDMETIEPFTMLTFQMESGEVKYFSEFVWDGVNKNVRYPNKNKAHIWSSSTLYNGKAKLIRKIWFDQFLEQQKNALTNVNVLDLHRSKKSVNEKINFLLKRDDGIKTVSITQIRTQPNEISMYYNDLLNKTETEICLGVKKNIQVLP